MNDKSKFKIAVVGIGGVGAYVGGKLAARFEGSDEVEVVLTARGENEKAMREHGLRIVSTGGEQTVNPQLVAPTEIDRPDLLLLCTKEYDLAETISSLKNSIGEQTAILPLLNGVYPAEKIARLLPETDVWQGCIYIVSRLTAPGVVEETAGVCTIFFGDGKAKTKKTERVEEIFRQAGIDAHFSEDVAARTWEKFVFISALAATTTFTDTGLRGVVDNPEHLNLLERLASEVKQVAAARKINISEEAIAEKFGKLKGLPADATTSMHTDFSRGNRAELESLVGYVVRQARALNVSTPVYNKIYEELAKKQKANTAG